ncbi:DUF2336 domain-containing protein [Caulobacter sp. 602-2]|uniref:DUF2336 domain-containing protein n=1 Tax=Caulobacter sp. 602-2 TaxID=2710887 RepID=A0A6G4QVL8_9CAUL|nr:DUF2336 domain-containing protein [Caulobacter sp. 602-2]NGM49497.1 DUF2336 domain-containing protein [Caulobacter sp. 602-2]
MLQSRLHDLIALADEPSSAKRRELLRGVTDLFFTGDDHGAVEMGLFDQVMGQLAGEMEEAVRVELAERLGQSAAPPPSLVRNLAADSIAVARPILTGATPLSDADLLHVAQTQGQEHLRAISSRAHVPSAVSDAIVARGDDDTLGVLIRNEGAQLSRQAHETVVDRAQANPALHEAVIDRQSLPIDLLNEMYFVAEARLRDRIMARNESVDPAVLEAALAAGRNRLAARDGALPADYDGAMHELGLIKARGRITPQALASMLRARQTTLFLCALSDMADIDFHTARKILERKELDGLAVVCKAADFDRALFLTFALLILDPSDEVMGKAKAYGELYAALPRESALRTIRFWRLRRTTGAVAAA